MKYLISLLIACFCSACATRKEVRSEPTVAVSGRTLSGHAMSEVRTPETVKAYPVGRYTDPNYPDEMHERHTLYRREDSPDWNYLPDAPYALPLGPTVANSDPSPSYYVKTDSEQMNAQQKAYAEALLEQNRAMKKRLDSMQEEAGKVPGLQGEIDRLKQELKSQPAPEPAPKGNTKSQEPPQPEGFSSVEPALPKEDDEYTISDPCEIVLVPNEDSDNRAFLLSQMRLNDEFIEQLAAAERRRRDALFHVPGARREELALLTKNTL
jgi:hypothetical protein